jgi:LEA14-like dessication related protein
MPKPTLLLSAGLALLVFTACGPLVKPVSVHVTGVSFSSRDTAEVTVVLGNPSRFALDILSAEYRITVGERRCGNGHHDTPIHVGARDSTEAGIRLAVDYEELLASLPELLRDTVAVKLDGSYQVKTALGARRVGFSTERRIAVKDQIRSFLDGLFGGE